MYHCGENEVPRNLARAVSIYKTAPRFGNQPMAILHEHGWGVKDSKALALHRYVKPARAGSAMALANIGKIHIWIDSGLRRHLAKKVDNQSASGAGDKLTSNTRIMKSGKK